MMRDGALDAGNKARTRGSDTTIDDLVSSNAKIGEYSTGNFGLRHQFPAEVSVTARLNDKVYM
jgi:hypothetical protein